MLTVIEKVADWLFGSVQRILIVAVLLVIGMAAAVGMVYKHERDTARAWRPASGDPNRKGIRLGRSILICRWSKL